MTTSIGRPKPPAKVLLLLRLQLILQPLELDGVFLRLLARLRSARTSGLGAERECIALTPRG